MKWRSSSFQDLDIKSSCLILSLEGEYIVQWCFIKWAHVQRERHTVLYSKLSDKLFHHVSYGVNHNANSQPFWDWDAEENRMDKGNEKLEKDWVSDFFVKFQMCWCHVTFDLETIVCKFGRYRAICLREEAICAKVYRRTDRQTTDAAPLQSAQWNELTRSSAVVKTPYHQCAWGCVFACGR